MNTIFLRTFRKYLIIILIAIFLFIVFNRFQYLLLPIYINIIKEKKPAIINVESNYYIFKKNLFKAHFANDILGKYALTYDGLVIKSPGAVIKFHFEKPRSRWAQIKIKGFKKIKIFLYLNNNLLDSFTLNKNFTQLITYFPKKYQKYGNNYLYFLINSSEEKILLDTIKFSEFYPKKIKTKELPYYYLPIKKDNDIIWISGAGKISYFLDLPEKPYLQYWLYLKSRTEKKLNLKVSLNIESENFSYQFEHKIENLSKFKQAKNVHKLKKLDNKKIKLSVSLKTTDFSILNKISIGVRVKIRGDGATSKAAADFDTRGYNVIYIILDAASASHFSCYGYLIKTTPNIDKFSEKSIIFANAYTVAVFTRTSTASLFTSLYPGTHKIFNITQALPSEATTLAEIFQNNGYKTAMFSTTVNISKESGFAQGFADYSYYDHQIPPIKIIKDIINWLKRNKNNKYFLYAHFRQPHYPLDAPMFFRNKFTPPKLKKLLYRKNLIHNIYTSRISATDELKRFIEAQYDANLNYIDFYLQELLSFIFKEEINKNTFIIISSDHGESLGEFKWKNKSYFGHGADLHKQSIHIPLIIYHPKLNKNKIIKAVIENIDIAPTLMEMLALKSPQILMQGKSFSLCFFSRNCVHKSKAFSQIGNYRLISAIDTNFHMIFDKPNKLWTFYDLTKNPKESDNHLITNSFIEEFFRYEILQYITQNITLGRIITKDWQEKEIVLSPQDIEQLKALGYIK